MYIMPYWSISPPLAICRTLLCYGRLHNLSYVQSRALHRVPIPMPKPTHVHGFWTGMTPYYCSWVGMGGYCFLVGMDGHSFQVGTKPMPINIA